MRYRWPQGYKQSFLCPNHGLENDFLLDSNDMLKTISMNEKCPNILTCSWLMLCRYVSSHDLNLVSLFCWHLDGDGPSKPDCVVQDDIVGGVVVLPKTHKYVGEFSSQTLFSAMSGH